MAIDLTPDKVLALISGTGIERYVRAVARVTRNGHEYGDLFRVSDSAGKVYALKIRSASAKHVHDSLQCLEQMHDPQGLVQRPTATIVTEEYTLQVSPWLRGDSPYPAHMDELPKVFARLARFNQQNITGGPYTSMYADGRYSNSIDDLVSTELTYHWQFFDSDSIRSECMAALKPLRRGLGCIINEDTNTGNVVLLPDDSSIFTDTEWVHRGLNLHQFDHFNYFRFEDPDWFRITDQAADCYVSYFEELGADSVVTLECARSGSGEGDPRACATSLFTRCPDDHEPDRLGAGQRRIRGDLRPDRYHRIRRRTCGRHEPCSATPGVPGGVCHRQIPFGQMDSESRDRRSYNEPHGRGSHSKDR